MSKMHSMQLAKNVLRKQESMTSSGYGRLRTNQDPLLTSVSLVSPADIGGNSDIDFESQLNDGNLLDYSKSINNY